MKNRKNSGLGRFSAFLAAVLILCLVFALTLSGCGMKLPIPEKLTENWETCNPGFEEVLEKIGLTGEDVITRQENTVYFAGILENGDVDVMQITYDGDRITSMYESIYYLPENYTEDAYDGLEDFARDMKENLDAEDHLEVSWEALDRCFRISCDMKHLEWKEDVQVLLDLEMLILKPGEDGLLSLKENTELLKAMDFQEQSFE